MGFGFLAPMFLAGFATLAIPVLVHLVHKQDATVRAFPSLMFLQRAPSPLQRRREIRHWLLLALRCLGLALLVFAFAQPYFERDAAAVATQAERRDLVLLVDRSYSMGYGDHWRRAQQAARVALDGLAGGDRVALVYFDAEARMANDFSTDHGTVAKAIESTNPSASATDLTVGLRRAVRLFDDSDAKVPEIRLISDFQRSGWTRESGIEIPENIRLETVEINSPETRNNAVWVSRLRPLAAEGSVAIEASVRHGRATVEPLQITLSSEGTATDSVVFQDGSAGQQNTRFRLPAPSRGSTKGEVRIPDDALPVDDRFRFAVRAARPIQVLVVEGTRSRNHQSVFLLEALRLSEDPQFAVVTKRQDRLESGDLRDADVVVFNEISTPDNDLDDELLEFVASGGGLLVVLGPEAADMATLGPRELTPALPATGRQAEANTSHRITWIDISHPALAVFSIPGEVDLSSPRFSQYRALELTAADSVLARFDDGGAALVERLYEKGRVLIFSTTLDAHWSDLPLQPIYLPLVHGVMRYLAGYAPLEPWHSVGDSVDLLSHFRAHPEVDAASIRAIDSIIVESPNGRQIRVPAANPILFVDEPGWYELHAPGEENLRDFVAVNVDPGESDLTPVTATAFLASIDRVAIQQPTSGPKSRVTPVLVADTPRIWWYVLLLAAIILATETLVSNRRSGEA